MAPLSTVPGYRDIRLPFALAPNPKGDWFGRRFAALMALFSFFFLVVGAEIAWTADKRGEPIGGLIFILICAGATFAGCLAAYRFMRASAKLTIVLTSKSIWLGSKEIPWDRISVPTVQEIVLEGGPSEYLVTFCVEGDQVFSTWPQLNPRYYVSTNAMSVAEAAEVLCRCLSEAKRQSMANAFDRPVASLLVHDSLRVRPAPNFAAASTEA